jgi:exodeoxyribonuclease VII large subunit
VSTLSGPERKPQQNEEQLGFSFESPVTRRIWSVADLVSEVRLRVEREYGDLWVEGEISNLRSAPSGHVYFTLKDGDAQLPAVLFRRQASLLRFKPADGLHVLLRGKVSVYEQRGQMQLVAEFLEPVGAGSLQIAFEQLKVRLQARGFFDAARKKPLPAFPHCVGIVTSPSGAVIRDFLNIVGRRHAGLHVLLRGKVSVYEQRGQMQLVAEFLEPVGAGSLQIAFEQLKVRLQTRGLFDPARKKPLPAFPHCVGIVTSPSGAVIRDFLNIVGRRHAGLHVLLYPASVQGEGAAAEVAAGIGYFNRTREVDVIVVARGGGSLEDLAPFNTEHLAEAIAASELPVISAVGHETDFTIADFVADLRAPTPSAAAELVTAALHNVTERVQTLDQRLVRACRFRLIQAANAFARVRVESIFVKEMDQLRRRQQHVDQLCDRLAGSWRQQYRRFNERLQALAARLLRQDVAWRMGAARERLLTFDARMIRAQANHLRKCRERQTSLMRQLDALSPLAVLSRGYALVYNEGGALIRSAADAAPGESTVTRLAHGRIRSRVVETEDEKKGS